MENTDNNINKSQSKTWPGECSSFTFKDMFSMMNQCTNWNNENCDCNSFMKNMFDTEEDKTEKKPNQ